MTSAEENFNIQWIGLDNPFYGYLSAFYIVTPTIPQHVNNKVIMVVHHGVVHELITVFHSLRLTWSCPLLSVQSSSCRGQQ